MKQLVNQNKWWLLGAAWVYTFTFVFNHYWSRSASYEVIAQNFSKHIQADQQAFDKLVNDTEAIASLLRFQPDNRFNQRKNTYYYLYKDGPNGMQLYYWGNAGIIPSSTDIPYQDTLKTVAYSNGFYVMNIHKLPGTPYTVVQLILIRQQYYVETAYLQNDYPGFPGLQKHLTITTTSSTPFTVRAYNNQPLFYLRPFANRPVEIFNWASLLVQVLATLMLLIFIYRVGIGLVQRQQVVKAFIWLIISTILIRLCIEAIHFPINVSDTLLFQPARQPSFGFSSLGSLLLNLQLLVGITYFLNHTQTQWLPLLDRLSSLSRKMTALLCLLGLVPVSFYLCNLVLQIAAQPAISFDITNIFGLGWPTVGAIICLYLLTALHYRLLHLVSEVINRYQPVNPLFKLLLAAITGLVFMSLGIYHHQGQVFLFALIWLLVTLLLEDGLPRFFFYGTERSVRFVFWLIWYSVAGTVLIQSQQQQKDLTNKLHLAKILANQESNTAVSLIHQGLARPAVREALRSTNLNDSVYNSLLREKIAVDFDRQLNGYTTRLYFFDSSGGALFNRDSIPYETLNTIVSQQGEPTRESDIYLYESAFDQFQYIVHKSVGIDSVARGTLFMTITPNSAGTQALLPELFKPLQPDMQKAALFDYALYKSGRLISSTHQFPFPTLLPSGFKLQNEYEMQRLNRQDILWYNAGAHRLIAVVKPGGLFPQGITLFAYLFGSFIFLYGIEQLLLRLLTGPYRLHRFWTGTPLSIRSKIRRTVLLVSVLSFVLIGTATVYFFIQRYRQNDTGRLITLVSTVEKDLRSQTDIASLFSQPYIAGTPGTIAGNSVTVTALADLLGIDINLFDLNGNLTATSQPLLYERRVVSTKMNPVAYYQMTVNKPTQFLQFETVGLLTYQGVYLPVRSSDGNTLGYINIPYFASQVELSQEISNFLVTLINLIAFISIIAGVLAFFITNSITNSFYTIGQKMKAISIGGKNEPIRWNRNDEIGILVQQYNKMLEQLDESARKLASNEREMAWREMAKQVAHEIKNPLTPMKLNLQYLQRQLQNNAPNVKEAAAKTATMLVEQIDHLSQIASDFSQLARINVVRVERFDLNEVLRQIILLYKMDSHFAITFYSVAETIYLLADRTQINRLFTNLIKNAGEAVEDEKAVIDIQEKIEGDFIIISITDNGPGIPTEIQPQLFQPNFTTKSSGSGLGLAICKEIVEQAGGAIWFHTQTGGPTTFTVRLPGSQN